MTKFDFNIDINRRGTSSLKWEKYNGTGILPMWVADMDFLSPPAVLDALHERVDHGVFGYTLTPIELQEVVIGRLARLYGWSVDPTWIVWLPGLVPGLNISCRAVGQAGDDVATFTPIYPPFLTAPRHVERQLITMPLSDTENGWEIDFEQFQRLISPKLKLLLFCHPHNPVGRVWSHDELRTIVEICKSHNVVICSDEIHCELILDKDKRHIPIAMLDDEFADHVITLMAPSKTFNIAGLGCSFAIIKNNQLRNAFHRAMAGLVPEINLLGFQAAIAAYKHGDEWLTQLLDYLETNSGLVESAINRISGLRMHHVEATYLAWIDARQLPVDNPAAFFEIEAGVGMSDGADFGSPGYVRLNFGCTRLMLEEALQKIAKAVNSL